MCTVTYIPTANDQFILTSNRDELPERSPQRITQTRQRNRELLFPRDTAAGGTWIAVSQDNRVICLLNGAFERHQHQPPYAKSRGTMVLEYFDYATVQHFRRNYHFTGMEPFTMIVVEQQRLFEMRWDEQQLHYRELAPRQAHIWSSATLYPTPIREKREQWFAQWLLANTRPIAKTILQFHHTAGEGDAENDLVMKRSYGVQTVSITSIIRGPQHIEMQYHDLIHSTLKKAEIKLASEILESH